MGFEHTVAAFERPKTFHALDHAATVTGPDKRNVEHLHPRIL
jgi:hypothetical protein